VLSQQLCYYLIIYLSANLADANQKVSINKEKETKHIQNTEEVIYISE
jgi:hypothetical protein